MSKKNLLINIRTFRFSFLSFRFSYSTDCQKDQNREIQQELAEFTEIMMLEWKDLKLLILYVFFSFNLIAQQKTKKSERSDKNGVMVFGNVPSIFQIELSQKL